MNKFKKTILIALSYLIGLALFVILSFFSEYYLFVGLMTCLVGLFYYLNGYLSLADIIYLGLGTTRLALYHRFMKRLAIGVGIIFLSFLYLEFLWVIVKETRQYMENFPFYLMWFLLVFVVLMGQLGMLARLLNLTGFVAFAIGTVGFGSASILVITNVNLLFVNLGITIFCIFFIISIRKWMQKVRMDHR